MGSIRPYFDAPEVEVAVHWYEAAPSARPLGFVTAFGDSWYRNNHRFRPRNGMGHKFRPVWDGNTGGFLGVQPCGTAETWLNGISLFNPLPPCECQREAVLPWQEIPAGLVDGVNRVFTLSKLPISAVSVLVMVGGVVQVQNVNYSLSGRTIFFTAPSTPSVDSNIAAYYWYLS